MQYSVYYNLNKPDYVDQYDLRHWNENTDAIDTILKNHADLIEAETANRVNAENDINSEITKIKDGTTVVEKAKNDKDGNQIDTTYQKKSYKVSSWGSTPNNDNYPTEKLVKDNLDGKVSQIKINGNAINMASDKSVNIQTSFKIQDSKGNTGAIVSMSNGEITIMLPSTIYGAVFN